MTINESKIKRDELLQKIEELRAAVAQLEQDGQTASLYTSLSDLEKELMGKKYGLVYERHREEIDDILDTHVPIPAAEPGLSIDRGGPVNFIIEGDNLASLQMLLRTHREKIDIIYIDPPYNRGKRDFIYDDDYIETTDSFRHSKWLSFMERRLRMAKHLLAPHGTIFMSCDDNEQAALRMLCDEIFQERNFEGDIHWRRRHNQPNDKTKLIGLVAEHILVYARDSEKLKAFGVGKVGLTGKFSNPDNDPKGPWATNPWKAAKGRGGVTYTIVTPTGRKLTETWYGTYDTFQQYLADGRVHWTSGGKGIPRIKIYQSEALEQGQCATNWWPNDEVGSNQEATDELKGLFDGTAPFENPKPTAIVKTIVQLGCIKKDALVLDFFAGSGTTAHAVLALNEEDGGGRRFILCTDNQNDLCRSVTLERVRRVLEADDLKASVKYIRMDYLQNAGRLYYEYADGLLQSVGQMIELENGVDFTKQRSLALALSDEELEGLLADAERFAACRVLYLGHDVLMSGPQQAAILQREIEVRMVPDYYYKGLEG